MTLKLLKYTFEFFPTPWQAYLVETSNGLFSVCSALMEDPYSTHMIRNFSWRAWRDILPMKDNPMRRHVIEHSFVINVEWCLKLWAIFSRLVQKLRRSRLDVAVSIFSGLDVAFVDGWVWWGGKSIHSCHHCVGFMVQSEWGSTWENKEKWSPFHAVGFYSTWQQRQSYNLELGRVHGFVAICVQQLSRWGFLFFVFVFVFNACVYYWVSKKLFLQITHVINGYW